MLWRILEVTKRTAAHWRKRRSLGNWDQAARYFGKLIVGFARRTPDCFLQQVAAQNDHMADQIHLLAVERNCQWPLV